MTVLGRNGVSERLFHAEWQRRLAAKPEMIADGWYTPPPQGMAVLFGDRVTFDTLRNPEFWPGERVIHWSNDLMFAYCSPVGRSSGFLGDVSQTLYFGSSRKILQHFRNTGKAIAELLDVVEEGTYETSLSLVSSAYELFARHGLKNAVVSINDPTATINMGHTFPWRNYPMAKPC